MKAVDLVHLGSLAAEEVLYEFEGPCIFTARTEAGALLLAYLVEDMEDDGHLRYIVATTSDRTIEGMKRGLVSVRAALLRGSMWLVDLDYALRPLRAFVITPDRLPDDAMPDWSTMLWAHLEHTPRVFWRHRQSIPHLITRARRRLSALSRFEGPHRSGA